MECKQCKKACENNHVYVRELPDTQALPLCRIKERVPLGTRNIGGSLIIPINVWSKIGQIWDILVPEVGGRADKIASWADASQIQVRTKTLASTWRSGPCSDKAPWPREFFFDELWKL